jgi:hypothetical protein
LLPYASDFVTDATGFTINVQTELTTDPIVGTCTRITESVSSTLQRLRISNPLYQGTNRMVTVWVKPEVDTRYFLISSLGASVDPIGPDSNRRIGVIFDLQEMTFTARSSISVIPYIEQRAGGWYKLTAVNVNDSDTTNGNRGWGVGFVNSPTNANTSYAGTGRQALIAFGGAFQGGPIAPTSEILTTGSAQTRNADVITKTGLGSVLPQTEGAVYCEVTTRNIGSNRRFLDLATDANNTRVTIQKGNGNDTFQLAVIDGGVAQALISGSAGATGTIHSYAIGSGAITDASAIQLTTL